MIKEHKVVAEVKLKVPELKPNEETIALINDLNNWAKTGELQEVMIVGKRANGYFLTAYSDSLTIKDLVFGMFLLDSRVKEWLTYSGME